MIPKACVFIVLVALFVKSGAAKMCPTGNGLEPELSTTFLEGYWYEHFYTTTVLNDNACSHFEIKCNNSDSSCDVQHVIWHSYLLDEIWNGTIGQNETAVELTINRDNSSDIYDVNLKFQDDAVLIWSCKNETEIEFASVLVRMKDDEEMEVVWDEAKNNMNYLSITDEFPAGVWRKIDTAECTGSGGTSHRTFLPRLLLAAIFILVSSIEQAKI